MEAKRDEIGNLFAAAFEKHAVDPERSEWEILNTSLQKRNFFKFNPFQFNVYYVCTILFCFFTCLGVGSHFVYKEFYPKDKEVLTTEVVNPRTVAPLKKANAEVDFFNSTPPVSVTENNKKTISTKQTNPKNQKTPLEEQYEEKLSEKDQLGQATIKDTIITGGFEKQIVIPDTVKPPKQKRTFYLTKQDTIYKYDTVVTPKPKKRRWK